MLLCLPVAALAGSAETGTTSLNFLKVGVGARAAGMGSAYTAVANDASAIFWNPAGLVEAQNKEIFLMHHRWIADISQSAASYVFDLQQLKLALSMNYFDFGELERRGETNSDISEGVFTPYDLALGISAAYRVGEFYSVGLSTRFVRESIDSEDASTVLFDLGFKAKTAIEGLEAAFTLRNLGPELKYENEGYAAPRLISLGAVYRRVLPWRFSTLLLSGEIQSPNDNDTRLALGGEYGYRNFLFARMGYRSGLENENFSWGLGLSYLKLRFDYGFVPYSELGSSHRFSFFYGL